MCMLYVPLTFFSLLLCQLHRSAVELSMTTGFVDVNAYGEDRKKTVVMQLNSIESGQL